MGSPSSTSPSAPDSVTSSIDDSRRVKVLCSFLGSIMPRPQDGKLRYVGGETRIVSVLRDICYEDLMSKLRELYEGATVLKYQQPDEDLDALVSVVNDDDVVNMMEEYDKLGSCDSFTKLRLFLFSHSDHDGAVHFIDGDDKKTERRYMDALNNLNDTCELGKQHLDDIAMGVVDDIHAPEQFISPINVDGRLHSQRSGDLPLLPYNLRLNIPHMGSGQHQQILPVTHRCSDVDMPWSSGYYSPRHHEHHDPRSLAEFPSSPSPTSHRFPFSDSPTEEFTRPQISQQPVYEHQPQYPDNIVWYPPGVRPIEKAGFPGNILYGLAFERNGTCESCRASFLRGQPHLEHLNLVNGSQQVASPCAECHSNLENFVLTADKKLHPVIFSNEQSNDSRSVYNDCQSQERGRFMHHHINNQVEEARPHVVSSGRLNDRHIVDSPGVNFSVEQGNLAEGNVISSSYTHLQNGPECSSEVFGDQTGFSGSHVCISLPEDCGVKCGNTCYAYTGDNHYSSQHGPMPGQGLWRNYPVQVGPVFEAFGAIQQVNGTVNPGFVRTAGSPRFYLGPDNQAPWGDSQKILEYEGKLIPDCPNTHALKPNNTIHSHDKQQQIPLDPNHPSTNMANMEYIPLLASSSNSIQNKGSTVMPVDIRNGNVPGVLGTSPGVEDKVPLNVKEVEVLNVQCNSSYVPNKVAEIVVEPSATVESISNKKSADNGHACKAEKDKSGPPEGPKLSVNNLSFVPELIASIKKAAVDGAQEVKANVKEHDAASMPDQTAEEPTTHEVELNDKGDVVSESENENTNACRIEPTKAEAEAISRGLQTIKNDDLEEVRELGSGTYGAVHHGKWKGSDVAIKRIKASCFAGRPSERERLIADFWKEALILSSLHHPNVVSFYGIVRDGPDGSLATVTEFMINGSLKQFLQKKDRTIDRRKRLIIAMDAAFGMEYLHGKNIVHFDLKCENLLVNMRDPQRPVCKIGDLGLSKVKQHTLVSGGVRGTLPWMAPELLSGKSSMVTEKIDVYSFGIVMWELLTGEEPYADMHCASMIGGIVNNTLRPQIPAWCDPEWKSLMESCWASDPASRPSFSEISQKLRGMAAAMNVK